MLLITKLNNKHLLSKAHALPAHGTVMQSGTYSYLKIADDFIHELHGLLAPLTKAPKPDYFTGDKAIGTHITIAYNEENIVLHDNDVGKEHSFTITSFCHVILAPKEYYVLMISAPTLTRLRGQYGLAEKPSYKNNLIDFHITLASQIIYNR